MIPFVLAADVDPPMDFPWATWFTILNTVLIFSMGAAAFNLLVGYSGQISLAHVAFLVLGTIIAAVVGIQWSGTFWLAVPMAAVGGAIVGVIVGLPALRLKHLYLLLATLGVHFVMLLIWREYLQANFGFVGIRFNDPNVPSWLHWLPFINPDENGEFLINSNFRWYWILMPATVASLLFMVNIVRTREGRAFAAVRERDVSASLLGVNVARSKLMAFAVSSAVVAMSGALGPTTSAHEARTPSTSTWYSTTRSSSSSAASPAFKVRSSGRRSSGSCRSSSNGPAKRSGSSTTSDSCPTIRARSTSRSKASWWSSFSCSNPMV